MPVPFTYDTTNRLFVLTGTGEFTIDAKEAYSQVKLDWLQRDDLNKFAFPIESIGGQGIGGGVTISPYFSLRYGWRIRPAEADSSITIVGNVITDTGADPFVGTIGTYDTVIKYVVSGNSLSVGREEEAAAIAEISATLELMPDQIWDLTNGIEPLLTPREAMRLFAAALLGKTSIADGTRVFRDTSDTKDRITVEVDGVGNRTSVSTDAT